MAKSPKLTFHGTESTAYCSLESCAKATICFASPSPHSQPHDPIPSRLSLRPSTSQRNSLVKSAERKTNPFHPLNISAVMIVHSNPWTHSLKLRSSLSGHQAQHQQSQSCSYALLQPRHRGATQRASDNIRRLSIDGEGEQRGTYPTRVCRQLKRSIPPCPCKSGWT